ncbi:MAG TPA: DMT family transporter [Dehalococcoidia bacterium]|nr:DMT family transporter [Dehalococcoidia bacterium]MDP6273035.1 DMT family transporter [Dehalococcoidia bacterium]MDP7212722.1 DMT family transporter [Dehalococcoidia bacterium]MDP7514928.1 DMT family transporter [Dehalococcoidia bacterium]HJM53051.1 DMT family transporter [Dehalococcoidia bacterium]
MGETLVLGSAFMWALATVLAKPMIGRIRPSTIVATHAWVAVIVGAILLVALGRLDQLTSTSPSQVLLLGLSGSFVVVGDIFLVRSFTYLDPGKAFTVASGLFVLFTLLVGWIFIGDPVTQVTLAGAMAIIFGVYMTRGGAHDTATTAVPGSTMAAAPTVLLAGLMWAAGLIGFDLALEHVDPIAGSTIGYMFPALAYLVWATREQQFEIFSLDATNSKLLAASATFGGFALVGYTLGIRYAHAGIVAMLESTAPIFAILLAVAFFKERLTARTGTGVGFCAVGIAALVI